MKTTRFVISLTKAAEVRAEGKHEPVVVDSSADLRGRPGKEFIVDRDVLDAHPDAADALGPLRISGRVYIRELEGIDRAWPEAPMNDREDRVWSAAFGSVFGSAAVSWDSRRPDEDMASACADLAVAALRRMKR